VNHFFESWEQFAGFASKLKDSSSPVARFERAVDAVVSGSAASLERILREYGGHVGTVKALLKRRPRLDVRDASFDGTPLGWAVHGWWERRDGDPARRESYYETVGLLVAAGAPVEPAWLSEENAQADPRMFAALTGKGNRF
jgi:hypothetical protein